MTNDHTGNPDLRDLPETPPGTPQSPWQGFAPQLGHPGHLPSHQAPVRPTESWETGASEQQQPIGFAPAPRRRRSRKQIIGAIAGGVSAAAACTALILAGGTVGTGTSSADDMPQSPTRSYRASRRRSRTRRRSLIRQQRRRRRRLPMRVPLMRPGSCP